MTSDRVEPKSPKPPRSVANVARWITLCLSETPSRPAQGTVPPLNPIRLVADDPPDEAATHC